MNGASRLNFRPLGRPGDVTRACECEATLSPEADVDPQGRATSSPPALVARSTAFRSQGSRTLVDRLSHWLTLHQ